MIYGYLPRHTIFKALATRNSSPTLLFRNKEVLFLGTVAGPSIGQGPAIDPAVSFPTIVGSAKAPAQQKTVSNRKVQQDPIHRVSKAPLNQTLEQHQIIHSTINGGDERIVKPVTPIKLTRFAELIEGFQFEDYLLNGLREGFRIGYEGPRDFKDCTNLKSCREHPQIISDKIATEVALGRIQGPFDQPPFPNIQFSPIGIVPKKKPGEFRLIQHLSYPEGHSINDFICSELSTVKYCSFDDAVAMVLLLGPGCRLCKTDIENAYRILPIHELDHDLLGIKWGDKYYYDNCMGLRSSAAIFDRFSSGLKWIAQSKLGINFILHILDDFLIMGPAESDKCAEDLQNFLTVCEELGVPIKQRLVLAHVCLLWV